MKRDRAMRTVEVRTGHHRTLMLKSKRNAYRTEKRRMKIYMAPMEGLTSYIYRNAYQRYFHNVDQYFTPFLANRRLNHKEQQDILPEHNEGMTVVPQILSNQADVFLEIAEQLREYEYHEVNLNLGCPSGTVAAKGRGAGFLAYPEKLDQFLAQIFEKCRIRISVKTRIGVDSEEEWQELLEIYNRYPLAELIVHPRIQKDFYKKPVRPEAFAYTAENTGHVLCYNGDIRSVEDYRMLCGKFRMPERIMLGRGLLANPKLAGELRRMEAGMTKNRETEGAGIVPLCGCTAPSRDMTDRGGRESMEILAAFHQEILEGYCRILSGDKHVLYKMIELWCYMGQGFSGSERYLKKLKKARSVREYELAVKEMFRFAGSGEGAARSG